MFLSVFSSPLSFFLLFFHCKNLPLCSPFSLLFFSPFFTCAGCYLSEKPSHHSDAITFKIHLEETKQINKIRKEITLELILGRKSRLHRKEIEIMMICLALMGKKIDLKVGKILMTVISRIGKKIR